MKINEMLEMINKFMPILEHYRDYTVDAMLNDIYQKCCHSDRPDLVSTGDAKPGDDKPQPTSGKLVPADAVLVLPGMDREAQLRLLTDNKYIVSELKEIARCFKLKIGKANKKEIIEMIVNRGDALDKPTDTEKIQPALKVSERVTAALEQITVMQQEEIIAYLNSYYKYEILEIGRRFNLRIATSNTKGNIILLIAKHIGYKDVHRRIAERPRYNGLGT